MSIYIIALLVIVIIILLAMPAETKDTVLSAGGMIDDKTIYNKSNGTFDGPAEKVFKKLSKKKNKTKEENGLLGRVISEAILEGEAPLRGQKMSYTMMAANNFNQMLADFNEGNNVVDFDQHLLESADDFNRILTNALVINHDILFPGENEDFLFVAQNLGDNIGTARKITNEAIRQQQRELSNTAAEAMVSYFDAAKTHTSDSQNSHDTEVSAGISASLNIIEKDTENLPANFDTNFNIDDVRKYIEKSDLSANKKSQALYSLNLIKKNNEMVSAVNKREIEAIRDVWLRAEHPGNADNKENIKLALADSLADIVNPNGWNQTNAACVSGRVARIVGSLSALDFDERVGGLITREQLENEILDNAGRIVNRHFEENKNTKYASIVAEFNTKDGPPAGQLLDDFSNELKEKINKMLDENNASPTVREKVYAGLSI